MIQQAASNSKFDFDQLLGSVNPELIGMVVLFMYFTIPTLSPTTFQRIAIGNNVAQVKKAFFISGIILVLI